MHLKSDIFRNKEVNKGWTISTSYSFPFLVKAIIFFSKKFRDYHSKYNSYCKIYILESHKYVNTSLQML